MRRSQTLCSWPAFIPRAAGAQRRTRSFPRTMNAFSTNTSGACSVELQRGHRPERIHARLMRERGWKLPSGCFVRRYVVAPTGPRQPAVSPPPRTSVPDEVVFFGRLKIRRGVDEHLRRNGSARLEAHCAVSRGAAREVRRSPRAHPGMPAVDCVARRCRSWPWTPRRRRSLRPRRCRTCATTTASPSCHRPSTTRRTQCRKR